MFFLLSSYQNPKHKSITVIELPNKNEQNMIIYMSCEEISKNGKLLIFHIIFNKLVHISRC